MVNTLGQIRVTNKQFLFLFVTKVYFHKDKFILQSYKDISIKESV
jgi:hypothetical protein